MRSEPHPNGRYECRISGLVAAVGGAWWAALCPRGRPAAGSPAARRCCGPHRPRSRRPGRRRQRPSPRFRNYSRQIRIVAEARPMHKHAAGRRGEATAQCDGLARRIVPGVLRGPRLHAGDGAGRAGMRIMAAHKQGGGSVEVAVKGPGSGRAAQLGHGGGFNLPDPLPGDPVDLADLFQGLGLPVGQPEPPAGGSARRRSCRCPRRQSGARPRTTASTRSAPGIQLASWKNCACPAQSRIA